MEYPIITIGREIGSNGLTIGKRLSEKLHIPLYDKNLLSIAARQSGLCSDVFEHADEKESYSFLQKALRSIWSNNDNFIHNENLFQIQSDTIRDISQRESCIFVGRCADYILRQHPKTLRIFVCAELDDRIANISQTLNISHDSAMKKVESTDKKRSAYYNFYTNKIWGQASSYDICLNTSLLGVEGAVDIVLKTFKKLFVD